MVGGAAGSEKKYRGRAGRLLVEKAMGIVKQKHCYHFSANVLKKNVRFFQGLNWKTVGRSFELNGKLHQLMEAGDMQKK